MGNTCYMNSTIQCLNATVPFARFFLGELLFVGSGMHGLMNLCRWALATCNQHGEPARDEGGSYSQFRDVA